MFDESRRAGLSAVVADRLRSHRRARRRRPTSRRSTATSGEPERQRLLDGVTVQETHFFRNPPQMEALRRRVLPELLRRAAGRDRPLTIWSAGCSTGEEPYTLAMLLLELSPMLGGAGARRAIVGTDVSAEALRAAGRATYTGRTRRGRAADGAGPLVRAAPRRALAVRDEVRRLVELRLHNLVTDAAAVRARRGRPDRLPQRHDLLQPRDTTRLLVGSFHDVLAEGGYLLLGHSETLWQVSDAFTLVPVGDAFVYRRSHDARRWRLRRRRRSVPVRCRRRRPAAAGAGRRAAAVLVPGCPPRRSRATDAGGAALLATPRGRLGAATTRRPPGRRGRGARRPAARPGVRRARPGPLHAGPGRRRRSTRCARPSTSTRPPGTRTSCWPAPSPGWASTPARPCPTGLPRPALRHRLDDAARTDLLGGRDVAELVDLCEQLAEQSRASAAAGRCRARDRTREVRRERLGHLRHGRPRDGRRARRGARGRARHRHRGADGHPRAGDRAARAARDAGAGGRPALGSPTRPTTGDILVLRHAEGVLGLAVDRVVRRARTRRAGAAGAGRAVPAGLPAYVVEVRRDPAGRPVLVVSLTALAGLVSA